MSVPAVKSPSVSIAWRAVLNVKRSSAAIVCMNEKSVNTVNMKERNKIMKTNKPIRRQPEAALRFSPTAWAKLIFVRDCTDNEVGAFGITGPDDLLLVEDIVIVKQTVSIVTVAFDDLAVADFFERLNLTEQQQLIAHRF